MHVSDLSLGILLHNKDLLHRSMTLGTYYIKQRPTGHVGDLSLGILPLPGHIRDGEASHLTGQSDVRASLVLDVFWGSDHLGSWNITIYCLYYMVLLTQ